MQSYDSFLDSEIFKQMQKEKQVILKTFFENVKGKSLEQALPFLYQANASLKQKNLSFKEEEKNFMISYFSKDLSPAERQKLQFLQKMMAK